MHTRATYSMHSRSYVALASHGMELPRETSAQAAPLLSSRGDLDNNTYQLYSSQSRYPPCVMHTTLLYSSVRSQYAYFITLILRSTVLSTSAQYAYSRRVCIRTGEGNGCAHTNKWCTSCVCKRVARLQPSPPLGESVAKITNETNQPGTCAGHICMQFSLRCSLHTYWLLSQQFCHGARSVLEHGASMTISAIRVRNLLYEYSNISSLNIFVYVLLSSFLWSKVQASRYTIEYVLEQGTSKYDHFCLFFFSRVQKKIETKRCCTIKLFW